MSKIPDDHIARLATEVQTLRSNYSALIQALDTVLAETGTERRGTFLDTLRALAEVGHLEREHQRERARRIQAVRWARAMSARAAMLRRSREVATNVRDAWLHEIAVYLGAPDAYPIAVPELVRQRLARQDGDQPAVPDSDHASATPDAALAQLRHAFWNAYNCRIGDQRAFADRLLAPAIRTIESMLTPAGEEEVHGPIEGMCARCERVQSDCRCTKGALVAPLPAMCGECDHINEDDHVSQPFCSAPGAPAYVGAAEVYWTDEPPSWCPLRRREE